MRCWWCEKETCLGDALYHCGHRIPFHTSCFEECSDLKLPKQEEYWSDGCACGCGNYRSTRNISIVSKNWFVRECIEQIVGKDILEQMCRNSAILNIPK